MNNTTKKHAGIPLPTAAMAIPIIVIALLAGCAQTTPRFDAAFGDAVRLARAQQTINPEASRNTDPVSGIDGRAAQEAINRYHKSFVAKEASPGSVAAISGLQGK